MDPLTVETEPRFFDLRRYLVTLHNRQDFATSFPDLIDELYELMDSKGIVESVTVVSLNRLSVTNLLETYLTWEEASGISINELDD